MEEKQKISQYRDKLDKTLMSHDLSNLESLRTLVGNQMSKSTQSEDQENNDHLVQKRTKEVANFLSMLRSASGEAVEGSKVNEIPHGGWKIKHDNEDCRVMYREGPAGTPFHTLLVEGYVDGPLDVCMCISWEAGLYQKWWPQFNIPTFKVIYSECVKNIRMGEQISLVRMKLPWPLSTREALVHYVSIDYFQDDLIIVLLNTIPETDNIDKSTHGFTKDGIPGVENVTRIDVVGGIALQKVSANRSYFRAIANMDIKLDFVPPAIINFVSRQLIGSGFKLYKKEVASVTKGDEDFSKVLKEPFYGHIREALYSKNNLSNGVMERDTVKIGQPEVQWTVSEIEEVEETGRSHTDNNNNNNGLFVDGRKEIIVSREVNQALGTLEKVISVVKEFGFEHRSLSLSRIVNSVFTDLEENKSRHKVLETGLVENNDINEELKNRNKSSLTQKKIKKQRFCCLNFTSGRLKS